MVTMKRIVTSAVMACLFPMISYADYTITNNTHFFVTADAVNDSTNYHTSCSDYSYGDAGVIMPIDQAPHNQFKIPALMVAWTCTPSCTVAVYIAKKCRTPKVATIGLSAEKGITEIQNLQNAEGVYIAKKNDNEVSIEGGTKATIFDLMFRKLGV